eukprot:252068_1
MDDVTYNEHTITFDVAGHPFYHKWHDVTNRGYGFIQPHKVNNLKLNEFGEKDGRGPPPHYSPGQSLPIQDARLERLQTEPPDWLTESELIALMDKHGIGTDA